MQNWHRTEITCEVFGHGSMTFRPYIDACSVVKCAFKPFPLPALGIACREAEFNEEKEDLHEDKVGRE